MMLGQNFYDIQSFTVADPGDGPQQYTAVVRLNPLHPVYAGHFPGNPVVPGVCQIQMVKELVEKTVDQQLILNSSDNIKFLSMINPEVNPLLEFRIKIKTDHPGQLSASATLSAGEQIFLKFKGRFETYPSCQEK